MTITMPPVPATDIFKKADQTARRSCDLIKTTATDPTKKPLFKKGY